MSEPLPWEGKPYSIKRYGVTINNCDREPVHTPGCIQGHGVLLVLRPADRVIVQASENTAMLLGQSPDALLGRSVEAAIGAEAERRLREFLASEPATTTSGPRWGPGSPWSRGSSSATKGASGSTPGRERAPP